MELFCLNNEITVLVRDCVRLASLSLLLFLVRINGNLKIEFHSQQIVWRPIYYSECLSTSMGLCVLSFNFAVLTNNNFQLNDDKNGDHIFTHTLSVMAGKMVKTNAAHSTTNHQSFK